MTGIEGIKGNGGSGVVVEFNRARRVRPVPHFWRIGDMARAGASRVRIAALDGGAALVVGETPFGPWSIWMEASKLRRAEMRSHAAPIGNIRNHENADVAPRGAALY